MSNYQVLCATNTGIVPHFLYNIEIDLIDQYKTALLQGKGHLIWEDGVLDCSKIVGITRTPAYKAPDKK